MELQSRKKGNVCIVKCTGTIRMSSEDKIAARIDALLEEGERYFVIDLLKVPWMDTAAITEIIVSHKHASEQGGKIKVVLNDKGHDLFTVTQLKKVISTYGDVESALGDFVG